MTGAAFVAHGVTLALAWFACANAVLGAGVVAASGWVQRRRLVSPRAWLALRLLPAVGALSFVAILFVPSYIRFEPRETVEGFDTTLTLCAVAAAALIATGCVRGVRAWRRASRQAEAWMHASRVLAVDASPVPAYAVDASFAPLMALVGVVRPRVFVSERLVAALTADELRATLAHEASHARAADNLKRLAVRAAPDLLRFTRAATTLERRWASAAEHAADRGGAGDDPAVRCALASALVKAARLVPPAVPAFEPISTFVGGGDIASRVEQLLGDAAPERTHRPALRLASVALALAGAAVAFTPLLRVVHDATEVLVNSLP